MQNGKSTKTKAKTSQDFTCGLPLTNTSKGFELWSSLLTRLNLPRPLDIMQANWSGHFTRHYSGNRQNGLTGPCENTRSGRTGRTNWAEPCASLPAGLALLVQIPPFLHVYFSLSSVLNRGSVQPSVLHQPAVLRVSYHYVSISFQIAFMSHCLINIFFSGCFHAIHPTKRYVFSSGSWKPSGQMHHNCFSCLILSYT